MMTERNTICIGQHLYRTEVSRSTEVAAPSKNGFGYRQLHIILKMKIKKGYNDVSEWHCWLWWDYNGH